MLREWFDDYLEIADEFCPYRELDGVDDDELTLDDVLYSMEEWALMAETEDDDDLVRIGLASRDFIDRWS